MRQNQWFFLVELIKKNHTIHLLQDEIHWKHFWKIRHVANMFEVWTIGYIIIKLTVRFTMLFYSGYQISVSFTFVYIITNRAIKLVYNRGFKIFSTCEKGDFSGLPMNLKFEWFVNYIFNLITAFCDQCFTMFTNIWKRKKNDSCV